MGCPKPTRSTAALLRCKLHAEGNLKFCMSPFSHTAHSSSLPHRSIADPGLSRPTCIRRERAKQAYPVPSAIGDGGGPGGRDGSRPVAESGDCGRWNSWQRLGLAVSAIMHIASSGVGPQYARCILSKYYLQAGAMLTARQAKEFLDAPAWRQNTSHLRVSVIIPVKGPCMPGLCAQHGKGCRPCALS